MLERIKRELKEGKTFLQFGFLKGLGQGLGMIAPLVVAKFFEPDLFGSYSLAKLVVFFFTTLLISSSQTPFIVLANQEKAGSDRINKTFSAQCLFFLLSCILFTAAVGIFNQQLVVFAKITTGDLWFLLLAFLGLGFKSFLCNLFMAMDERIKNSLAELVFGFFNVVLVFFFHFMWGLNLRTVLGTYPVAAVFLLTFFVPTIKFQVLRPLGIDIKYVWRMFGYIKWQFLGITAVYFIHWGDSLVLRYYNSSMDNIGVYNLAYQFFKGIITFALIPGLYFLPFVSQNINNSEKIRSYLWKKRLVIMILAVVFVVILFFILPYVIELLYNGKYKDSIPVLRVLLISVIISMYVKFYYNLYEATRNYKLLQFFCVAQVLTNIILNLILVPVLGILGAAVATVAAYFFTWIMVESHFSMRMKKILRL